MKKVMDSYKNQFTVENNSRNISETETVDVVFVVLVYRNKDDLIDFIKSTQKLTVSFKIVVVNSYYDDDSMKAVEEEARKHGCDFINVENKGYGYGNNVGISFAVDNYNPAFVVVSNPDIIIEKFDASVLSDYKDCVIGPIITAKNGNHQNPYWAVNFRPAEYLIYVGYKKRNKMLIYGGIIINKLIREIYYLAFRISDKTERKAFAVHGSFVLIPQNVLKKRKKLYDENMFLFAEEALLAHELKKDKISSYITKRIKVLHKEDGSMGLENLNTKKYIRESVVYYYEKIKQ